jgi:hypothetical protein
VLHSSSPVASEPPSVGLPSVEPPSVGPLLQAPEVHVSPAGQGAPVEPHWQPPEAVQLSDTVVSQGVHAPPGGRPHTGNPGVVHLFDRQQPEVHAPVAPQLQTPSVQPSPVGAQPTQTAPPVPHVRAFVIVTQVPPAASVVQHPPHDAESQKHAPPMQTWSDAQGPPVPHWQTPAAHVSVVAGHVEQAPPPTPHCVTLAGSQVGPVQHPLGQVSARQAGQVPPLHEPGKQLSHAAPPEPHIASAFPGSHVEPLQHPVHDELSQRHAPPEQC